MLRTHAKSNSKDSLGLHSHCITDVPLAFPLEWRARKDLGGSAGSSASSNCERLGTGGAAGSAGGRLSINISSVRGSYRDCCRPGAFSLARFAGRARASLTACVIVFFSSEIFFSFSSNSLRRSLLSTSSRLCWPGCRILSVSIPGVSFAENCFVWNGTCDEWPTRGWYVGFPDLTTKTGEQA